MALNPMTPAGILAPTLFHKTRMEYQPHLRHCRHYYTDLRFFMLGFINHTLEKKKATLCSPRYFCCCLCSIFGPHF